VVTRVLRRLRSTDGFSILELLMALTILNVGILAILGAFSASAVSIKQASRVSTAAALADAQMELYHGVAYSAIALDTASTASSPGALAGDYKCDTTLGASCPNSVGNEVTQTCTTPLPKYCKASQSATGADGGTYIVDTYILPLTQGAGRTIRQVTVVVRDSLKKTKVYVRQTSTFDQATG
jgi:type II secretory pathway pseudopilin PulG